jgi:hypothetical protein
MSKRLVVRPPLVGILLTSLALAAVVAGHRLLAQRQQQTERMQVALTLADAVAQAAASSPDRRTALLADLAARRPELVSDLLVAERDAAAELRLRSPAQPDPHLVAAARQIARVAADALRSGERLPATAHTHALPDGTTLVAAAFRAQPGGREWAGVGGVILRPWSFGPWPVWPAALAAVVGLALPWLLARAPVSPQLTSAIVLAAACVGTAGALPPLGPPPSAGVVVLAADWLVPHNPWPVAAAPPRWLQAVASLGVGAVLGAILPLLAGTLGPSSSGGADRAPAPLTRD